MKGKKGQAIFEFIIASIILFSIIIYTLGFVNGEITFFSNQFNSDKMESKVVQISESFLNPNSKHNIIHVGKGWPYFDSIKMDSLNTSCNKETGYAMLLNDIELFEIDPMGGKANIHIRILATDLETGTPIIDCGRLPIDIVERPPVYEIKRIGIDESTNGPVELKIWIW